VESYEFEIVEPFNRGEVVGGFYYHEFRDHPEKNKLRVFSKADIDKRKPDHASVEFWGGTKDQWVDGKKSGTVEVEGWYDEMAYKTIYKAAYNAITIDSQKIDDHYMAVIQREQENRDNVILKEIAANANKTEIGFDDVPAAQEAEIVDDAKPIEEQKEAAPVAGQQLSAPFA
jgi:recombination protein RecT